ncbi:hypothetical protein KR215_004400, partial [Drosophila sulfurigaster]
YSTGKCQYAAGLEFRKLCSGEITSDLVLRWMDLRVAKSVSYTVWQEEGNEDSPILVSFFDSPITRYEAVTVVPFGRFLKGKKRNEDKFRKIRFDHSDLHCFNYSLRYVVNLKSECLNHEYDENANVPRGILHYSYLRNPKGKASNIECPAINILIALFVVYI